MRLRSLLVVIGLLVGVVAPALLVAAPTAVATTPPVALPTSMASTGDSITRAFDIGWCCLLSDSPQDSWSTGTASAVTSQYQRVLAAQPAVAGNEYNDAKTGAKMADLNGQLQAAAAQHVQYVTVLMGANDVCTSSVATMTPTATFKSEFTTALSNFLVADPGAHVFVSSIPNIYQLWSTLHTNFLARTTWATFGICQSMLASSNTSTQRSQVAAQEAADNAALASVCATYSGSCLWDNYATYNVNFPASWVSTVDYFHPNVAGQNALASTSWAASYWPTTP